MPDLKVRVNKAMIKGVGVALFFCLIANLAFAANSKPVTGTITPSSGTSNPYQVVNFTTTYTDANGWQDMQNAYFLINSAVSGSNCFYGYYKRSTNQLFLRDSANTTWLGGFAPGSTNTIANSQAKLFCAQTTVSGSGTTLSITWSLALKSTFTGTKNTYLYITDTAGTYAGWTRQGTWKINPNSPPTVGSISPSSGTFNANTPTNFIVSYSDANTWEDIQYVYFLINTSTSGSKCFYGYYDQNANKLYLRNDANTAWLGGYAPGSSYTIENSYAKLNCAQTTVLGAGVTLTINWPLIFKSTFLGSKNMYLYVKDDAGAYQGWVNKGSIAINAQPTDTIPPIGTIKINNAAQYTNSASTTLSLSAQDNAGGSGLSQMQFSNDNITWSTPENYATTKTWALSVGDGAKTVYVKYKDVAGNWSQAYSSRIILDTTPPIGSLSINNGATATNTTSVTLSISATDSGSGMGVGAQMQFSNDGTTWLISEAYATTKNWALTSGDGTKAVYVKFSDALGNWSAAFSASIILNTKLKVDPVVKYQNVSIQVLAGKKDPGSSINVNNQQVIATNNYNSWYYEYPLANGSKISVTALDAQQNQTPPTVISLDDPQPTVNQPLITGIRLVSPNIVLTIQDSAGVLSYNVYYANSLSTNPFILAQAGVPVTGNGTTTWIDDGTYTGSSPLSVPMRFYKLEVAAVATSYPTGSIKINNGTAYTNSTSAILSLQATEAGSTVTQMQFSNDSTTWSTPESYSTTKSWTLASGDATKTVYVKFKDAAGNWSIPYSSSVVLDTTNPAIAITTPINGAVITDQ